MISDWITRITTCFEMRIASQGALRSPTGAEGTRPGPSMVQEYLQEGVCGTGSGAISQEMYRPANHDSPRRKSRGVEVTAR